MNKGVVTLGLIIKRIFTGGLEDDSLVLTASVK